MTREGAADIDAEIINAESQHKSRLKDEKKGEHTWHKTTIVIGSEDNPWPFSKMEDFEKYKNDRASVLRQAEYRIKRVALGAVAPRKA